MVSKKLPIVAIVGRANVGKSSLFNSVLNRREAIVAREAGTTRDSISAKAIHNGHEFWLVDTAGVKDPEDDFELTIQEQIKEAAVSADLIWVVIESNTILTEEDRRVAKMALKSRKAVILVVNKSDKAPKAKPEDYQKLGIKPIILTSTTQQRGIEELLDTLVGYIPKAQSPESENRLRLVILGRPNVGKSALFNSLAKKQQAIVADRAGTTRDVNRAIIRYKGQEIELMDTAGIRRSGKIGQGIERFSVIRALSALEESDIALLLMDANELNVQLDQKIAGMVKDSGKGLILIVSKWDLVEKDAFTHDALTPQIAHNYEFVPWAPLVFTSSLTGKNVTKIFDIVLEIADNRQTQVKTTELNRWLKTITERHPPAGLKNRTPKLNYIVQEADNPINFKVYGSHTKFLHWSYKRYMDRALREQFGFNGTPIRFWFFEKHTDRKHSSRPNSQE